MSYIYNPTDPNHTYTVTTPNTTGINYPYTITTAPNTGTGINWGTTTGSGTYSIADPNLKGATLQVKGDADFEGDLKLKGKSLKDSLERIEERLAILRPNDELEEKWENLRGLRKMYMELEAEIIEKEKMWDILKK
jgi:hypothetical protein